MSFRNFKCNFPSLFCKQLFTAHRSSTLRLNTSLKISSLQKTYIHSDKVQLTNFSFILFYFTLFYPVFKTENSWSNKAKSICQQQKPQRRPCSELLKYLTTNDDPPQTKPAENRNSSKEKCTSKRKPHLQSQTNHLQGRCGTAAYSFGTSSNAGKLKYHGWEYPQYYFCSLD